MSVIGLNHIVLKVKNLEKTHHFYSDLLGLKKVGKRPGMSFYKIETSPNHHDLAFVEIGDLATQPPNHYLGLFHFCFSIKDKEEMWSLHDRLEKEGVRILGATDHNMMHSFYVFDPDGNVVEFGVDLPTKDWMHLKDPFAFDNQLFR